MKKVLCFLLSILLPIGCAGCTAVISYSSETAVEICYDRENVSFDQELSQAEADAVLSVFNGKRRDPDLAVTGAACGFGRKQAFIIDGSFYCLAQDSCGVIWEEGTENYYILSAQEREQLEALFKAYGAKVV